MTFERFSVNYGKQKRCRKKVLVSILSIQFYAIKKMAQKVKKEAKIDVNQWGF
jgi:hypothetical protein